MMKKLQLGFTLVEVMVVVVILGILAAIIVPKIMSRPDEAKIVKAKQDILAIESALQLYKLDNGFYPSTDQGLKALVEKPDSEPQPLNWKGDGYLKQLPIDPWNKPYQYLNPGNHNPNDVDVFSYGPKGENTQADESAFIGNWQAQAKEA
jgi:general secretion pathway protein G